jgi:hypothetical protein
MDNEIAPQGRKAVEALGSMRRISTPPGSSATSGEPAACHGMTAKLPLSLRGT